MVFACRLLTRKEIKHLGTELAFFLRPSYSSGMAQTPFIDNHDPSTLTFFTGFSALYHINSNGIIVGSLNFNFELMGRAGFEF